MTFYENEPAQFLSVKFDNIVSTFSETTWIKNYHSFRTYKGYDTPT